MKTCPECGSQINAEDGHCARCSPLSDGRAKSLVGKTLANKYLIEESLGEGGMCDVYLATHMAMGKRVAVKVLKPQLAVDARVAQRFEQEARAASRIHHPNAINVIDYGDSETHQPFIVMEFVNGVTLGELLRRHGALSVDRAANILRQASGAIDAAHEVGVIHRDIKPDNIIIADYGGSDWVEVLDFGIAKIQDDVNRRASLTGANIIVGTPRYMSPEQCEEKPVDARSDVYSLGVVLYEMIAGDAPFQGDSSTRMIMAHATQPPAPLRQKRPDLSPEIEAVVMRALEKDPARRQQSAGELAQDFEQAAGISRGVPAGTARGGAFSRINVPIGMQDEIAQAADENANTLDDEATVVRRRPIRATIPVTNTPDVERVDTPYDLRRDTGDEIYERHSTPARGTTYVGGARERRSAVGWVIGVVLLLVVAGAAAYIVWGDKLFGKGDARLSKTGDTMVDALSAITDASARIDSLPQDHPLRRYSDQLAQWKGELRAYQQVSDRSPQVMDKAERYMQQAENISAQARAALIALGRESPTNSNSAAVVNANTPSVTTTNTGAQPKEDAGAAPATEPEKKAEGEEEGEEKKGEQPLPPPPPLPEEKQPAENANRGARKPPAPIPVKPSSSNTNKPPDLW